MVLGDDAFDVILSVHTQHEMVILIWKRWMKLIDSLVDFSCPLLSLKIFTTLKCLVFISLVPIWQSDF